MNARAEYEPMPLHQRRTSRAGRVLFLPVRLLRVVLQHRLMRPAARIYLAALVGHDLWKCPGLIISSHMARTLPGN